MLIINADDWGRSKAETDSALSCHALGTITSVSAMVFMSDSERAARIASDTGIDTGLHVNFTEAFTGQVPIRVIEFQSRIAKYLKSNKYSQVFYNPFLRNAFRYVYKSQVDEFARVYGHSPSHIDGHQHMHLCSNMLIDRIIPRGQRVRGTFSFSQGERGWLNLTYRKLVQGWLRKQYCTTDFFFALSEGLHENRLDRIIELSKSANVELMAHPANADEYAHLTSREFRSALEPVPTGTYAHIQSPLYL